MAKGQIVQDTFEKLAELGVSTAKKTGKSVAQTFSPLKILEQTSTSEVEERSGITSEVKRDGHTPLNFESLKKKYADQDVQKETELRNRLFQLVKEGEKEAKKKAEEKEKERQQEFTQEDREKKKKEEEKRLQEQQREIPRGKRRRSIFSPKAKTREKHAEFKPASSKQ